MEYGNIVWGGTYDSDIVKLERIQIDALRLITGATARCNISNLYVESKLMTIPERIDGATLNMMFKIIYGIAPEYLQSILTQYRNHPIGYVLRNRANHVAPFTKQTCRNSFFYKGICLWENLNETARIKPSPACFKSYMRKEYPRQIPLYYYGERWPQVHHARLRIGCSKLNNDLYNNLHVIDHKHCECGYHTEDANHFLLECNRHTVARNIMINQISAICAPTCETLLYGNPDLSFEQNKCIFAAVHKFMIDTARFN
jgi:hypothetical protein